jgi:hypothetical protein
MSQYNKFSRPLLMYDDKCSSCTKFARAAAILSRGWIRTAGHYYSEEATEARKIVFPAYYDSTKMFWLINKKEAYGARLGLIYLTKEIMSGLFKRKQEKNNMSSKNSNDNYSSNNHVLACDNKNQVTSCESAENTLRRIINMMRTSGRFQFQNNLFSSDSS